MNVNVNKIINETRLNVKLLQTTSSTFNESATFKDGLVIALEQTNGVGRDNREFVSPKGGLYLGLNLPFDYFDPTLTPKIGLAVMDTLRSYKIRAYVKWLNDVYVDGKKVCGILCKIVGDRVLIGVGINYATDAQDLKSVEIASSLNMDKNNASEFIIALVKNILYQKQSGFDDGYYTDNCVTIGKNVTLQDGTNGVALCVTKDGELVVKTQNHVVTVNSGDVTVNGSLKKYD